MSELSRPTRVHGDVLTRCPARDSHLSLGVVSHLRWGIIGTSHIDDTEPQPAIGGLPAIVSRDHARTETLAIKQRASSSTAAA